MDDEEKQVLLCCAKLLLEIKPLLENITHGLAACFDGMQYIAISNDNLRKTIEGIRNGNYEESEENDYE